MAESVRVIKKYQNRKLYDTQDSCYVTLDGIAKMIRDGEEIVVIDNNSKEDVTALILTQVLYEQEKNHQSVLPVSILKNIIKSSSNNLYEFMHKYILGAFAAGVSTQEDINTHIDRLTKRGDLTADEAQNLQQHLKAQLDSYREKLDLKIEERLEKYVQTQSTSDIRSQFQDLSKRLSQLENR